MAIDELTYPAPNVDRSGPGPSSPPRPTLASAGGIPRTRVFPFRIVQGANRRDAVCTPRLVGPVILRWFSISQATKSDPPANTWEVGWSPVAVVENGVALTTPRPYTVLTELLDPQGVIGDDRGRGFVANTVNVPTLNQGFPLNLIIDAAEVFIVIASVQVGALAQNIDGLITVLEAVPRETLEAFL